MDKTHIYHVAGRPEWQVAKKKGQYVHDSLKREGFIHFSTRQQVKAITNRFFKGKSDLILLKVEVRRLKHPLRYEKSKGQAFPHLYGPLNIDAVAAEKSLKPNSKGEFSDFDL